MTPINTSKKSPLSIGSTYVGALIANKRAAREMISPNHAGRNAVTSANIRGLKLMLHANVQHPLVQYHHYDNISSAMKATGNREQ